MSGNDKAFVAPSPRDWPEDAEHENGMPGVLATSRPRRVARGEGGVMYVPPNFAALTTPRDLNDWHDDDGDVLWWLLVDGHTVSEPPTVGSPLCTEWEWAEYVNESDSGEPGDWVFCWSKYPEARLVWTPLPQIARFEPLPAPAPESKEG